MDPWSPAAYGRFARERNAPFFDLLAMVRARPGLNAVDLGCGTGELTRILHLRLKAASTLGIDRSEAMLAESRRFRAPGLAFRKGDLGSIRPPPLYGLVFSNAALQWIPGHRRLLARLTRILEPGGILAVQVPANHRHPSHRIAAAVAREEPFLTRLEGYVRRSPVLEPEDYDRTLAALGFAGRKVRLKVYLHHLPSREGVVSWMEGTGLTPYRERLGRNAYGRFLDRYRERLFRVLEDRRPFPFPFRRILIRARLGRATSCMA